MPVPTPRRAPARVRKGERTRDSILRVAVDLASVEGLEGLSIGRLADELKMSKSGLFAHFGSKQDLQIATVETARQIFTEHVIRPALEQPAGMPRLWALCDRWIGHVEEQIFAGGCFFTAASFEFDSRPGPVRKAIVEAMKKWLEMLTRAVEEAQKAKHLKNDFNPAEFAFEIYSIAIGADWGYQLLDQKDALARARKTMIERLRAKTTPDGPRLKFLS